MDGGQHSLLSKQAWVKSLLACVLLFFPRNGLQVVVNAQSLPIIKWVGGFCTMNLQLFYLGDKHWVAMLGGHIGGALKILRHFKLTRKYGGELRHLCSPIVPCLSITEMYCRTSLNLGAKMFYFYISMNLLILFASYVHVHLFAPLIICVLPTKNQTEEKDFFSQFWCPKIELNNLPPWFIHRSLSQVLDVAHMGASFTKLELALVLVTIRLTISYHKTIIDIYTKSKAIDDSYNFLEIDYKFNHVYSYMKN